MPDISVAEFMPEVDADLAELGDWTPIELAETARAEAGVGADADLPKDIRFKSSIAKLLRRRRALPAAVGDPTRPAIFLLHPSPVNLEYGKKLAREPMLDNGLTAMNGRVWFVAEVAASGRYLNYEAEDDDDLFRLVTETFLLGATPAILFDPRLPIPETRYYPEGLGNADVYETISLGDPQVTLENIFATIERVYRTTLVTPGAAGIKLWADAPKWWPSRDAEKVVQALLTAGLAGALPTCIVRNEQPMPEGRLDILIEEGSPLDRSIITLHAILELKVLRSFGSTGDSITDEDTLGRIQAGVEQAAAYRDSRGARQAALCCFDMRITNNGDTCFEHVLLLATRLSVTLKRWFLYAQARYLRNALATGSG